MRRWPLLALSFAACQVGAGADPAAEDPQVFSVAQDPVGKAAWVAAQQSLARRDLAAALPDLRTAVERCPDLVRAHLAYQDTARELGGDALQTMLSYYQQLPERASPVPAYCKARLAETSFARGTALQAIVARHASFAFARLSLARVYRRKGDLLQAVDAFRAAIERDATLHEARLERAQVLAEIGRAPEAAVDYEAYLALMPADDVARHAYAQLAIYRLGRIDKGQELLDQLERSRGGDLAVRMDRAAAQWLGGDPSAAVRTYLQVLEVRPGDARALFNIGLLYYEVLPKDAAAQRVYWPKARSAFQLFQSADFAEDGHEQFERTLGVPYRLAEIAGLLGEFQGLAKLEDLQLPG